MSVNNNVSLINLNSQFNPFYNAITIESSGNVGVGKTNPSTNFDVSGNINFSGTISGSGSNLTTLNATNIISGVLSAGRGGTGATSLTAGTILVGNGTNTIIQPSNFVWDNVNTRVGIGKTNPSTTLDVNGTVTGTLFSGSGLNLNNLNSTNINSGILSVSYGGTGATSLTSGQLLIGNGTSTLLQSANLTWNNTTNTLSATNFTGSGTGLSALNASNITSGILPINYGGIGTTTLTTGQLLIGNGTNALLQTANLSWNNLTNTLSATNFIGSGTGLSALNASNIASGILPVNYGGIGTTSLTSGQILIGNGTGALLQSGNLSWNNTSNTLTATNFTGSGTGLTALNASNITSGILPINYGGTGATNLTSGQLLIGNGTNTLLQSANLSWNNTTNTLSATNFIGSGAGLTSLTASNITGTINISQGGTGSTTLTSGQVLIGNGTGALLQSTNLTWNNSTNTLSATNFIGNGSGLTALTASNISGNINVAQGGTGSTTLTSGQLLIGNGTNALLQSANLTWNNTSNTLSATNFVGSYSGSGAGLTTLNASNITSGALLISYGGTGVSTFTSGSVLIGNGANTLLQPSNFVWDNTNNRVGIGKTNPSTTLDVNGTITSTRLLCSGGALIIDNNNNINVNSGVLYVDGTNNRVGIGVTNSTFKFHVVGNTRIEGDLTVNGTLTQVNTNVSNTEQLLITNDGTGPAVIINQTGTQPILEIQDDSATCFKIFDGGNVGIGTSTKTVTVDISGNIVFSGNVTGSGANLSSLNATNITNGTLSVSSGGIGANTLTSGSVLIGNGTGALLQPTNFVWDNTNSRVGIGKTNPGYVLDVNGAINATELRVNGSIFTSSSSQWTTSGTTIYYNTGNIGIGTTVPQFNLQVGTSAGIIGASTLHLANGYMDTAGAGNWGIRLVGIDNGTNGHNLNIQTRSSATGTFVNSFSVTSSGNVGIGITNPSIKFETWSGGQCANFNTSTTTNSSYIGFKNTTDNKTCYIGVDGVGLSDIERGALVLGTWGANSVIFNTNGTEKMRILSGGNVGIGVTNPGNILQIGNAGRLRISNGTTDYTLLGTIDSDGATNTRIVISGNTRTGATGNIEYVGTSTGSHIFYTTDSTTERMRILSGGNVGIGVTNPSNKVQIVYSTTNTTADNGGAGLYVFNPTNAASNNSIICNRIGGSTANKVVYCMDVSGSYGWSWYLQGSDTTNKLLRFHSAWDAAGGSDRLVINGANGNVGVGTNANISSKLTINDIVIDRNTFDHSEGVLTVTHPTATSSTVLNDPKAVLHLCRQGTVSQAYGARASFKLCRWENNGLNSRSRLDLTLAHGTYDDVNVMSIESDGNVGIGKTNPTSTLDVAGNINFTGFLYKNNVLFAGGLSQGMTVQTKHLTYTQMDVKNNTGWDAINDDLSTGFVIAITPTNTASKILVNMIAHIGCQRSSDSRWWGIKLYRKIGTGAWTEVTGANGTETGAAASTAGTPCWVTHNTGMNDALYEYFISNVTGTYLDAPNTTSIVYYTAYWNNRLGDNPSASGTMWINRSERQYDDAYRPAPTSSWTATEIWDLGTPYTPPTTDNTITISSGNVGINIGNPTYKLQVEDGSTFIGDITNTGTTAGGTANGYRLVFDNTFNGTAGSGTPANKIVLHNNGTFFLAGFGIESNAVTYHSGGGHNFYTGSTNAPAYGTLRMTILSGGNVGIGLTNPTYTLDVAGTINCTTDMRVGGNWYWQPSANFLLQTSANNIEWSFDMQNQNTYTGCYWQVWSDKTGIGTILACRGDTGFVGVKNSAPAVALHVTGDIVATGNITAYYSDERLKTIISKINDPLKIINNLNGFYYTPNELAYEKGITHNDREIGLSAQDVQKVLPELVKLAPFDLERNKDGELVSKSGENYLTISYERLAPVFVESIKELNKEIETLKQENNDLKQKYDTLLQDMLLIKQKLKLLY